MVDFVEPIEHTSNLFRRLQSLLSKFSAESQPAICKNTTDNLLSSKPTVFIIAGKGVRSYQAGEALRSIHVYWYVNSSQLYAANQH